VGSATVALLRRERIAKKKRASMNASPCVIRLTFSAPWRHQSRGIIPEPDVINKQLVHWAGSVPDGVPRVFPLTWITGLTWR
jgi:hypothetical protein